MTAAEPAEAPPAQAEPAAPSGRRLTLNYLLLTGGESLAKVFTLAAFVYLGRTLGPERYGSLEFILATMIFFTLPVDFGIGVYGAREVARDRKRAGELLRDVTALRLLLAGVSFVVLLAVAALLPRDGEVKLLLVMYGVSLFAEPALVQWFFQGHDRMHWVALTTMVRKATFAGCVLLLVRPGTPLPWVGACECASALVTAAVCLVILRRRLGFAVPRPWRRLSALTAHVYRCAPIGVSHLAWAALWYFATVLMGWLAPAEEVGWFGASHRVVVALHTFVYLYFYNLLPSLSRGAGRPGELRGLLSRSLGLTTWGGILVALALTLVGGDVLTLLYGPKFLGVHRPLAVLGWLIPIALVAGHYRYLLIACNLQHLELRCTGAAALVAVALGAVLIPWYGAVGAAGALVIANLIDAALAYTLVNRRIAAIPCHAQLAPPLLAVSAAAACCVAGAAWDAWLAAAAAGVVYLVLFGAWAAWHFRGLIAWPGNRHEPCVAKSQ